MKNFKVTPGTYIPETGIEYPNDPSVRMYQPKAITHPFDIDETYPYYEDSWKYKLNRFIVYLEIWTYIRLMVYVVYGLRINRRGVMKKYKKEFKAGAITICNHSFRFEMGTIIYATRKSFYIPMLGKNMMTDDYRRMKYVGGIPIPSAMGAMKKYNESFDRHHELGHWFHIFPEGICWNFYKPLKPFYKGAFSMAYKYNIPILPLCVTYRPRTGIYRLFGNQQTPLITITIGDPIFPDTTKPRKIEVCNLRESAFNRMLQLAGIEENPWPCEPEEDN